VLRLSEGGGNLISHRHFLPLEDCRMQNRTVGRSGAAALAQPRPNGSCSPRARASAAAATPAYGSVALSFQKKSHRCSS
jgi:hypothetical protein